METDNWRSLGDITDDIVRNAEAERRAQARAYAIIVVACLFAIGFVTGTTVLNIVLGF